MSYVSGIFVSSSCYELRDLRAALKVWLTERGFVPHMSNDSGFPHTDGMPPYASCLKVLEQCQLVIGVVDRSYGQSFDDWGPYDKLKGCSPTHAELRYAFELKKRVLLFVHDDVWNFYEIWRKNKSAFENENYNSPRGLEINTLKMLSNFKSMKPVPWMMKFTDVSDIQRSIQSEFNNQIYENLLEKEKFTRDAVGSIVEKLKSLGKDEREKLLDSINTATLQELPPTDIDVENSKILKKEKWSEDDEAQITKYVTKAINIATSMAPIMGILLKVLLR